MPRQILPPRSKRVQLDASLAIVNIVLLLIFFFLATGSLLNSPSYGVDLSETEDLPIDTLPQPILIVEETGALSLNGQPVAEELLATAIEGEPVLHVLIRRDAPAMDLLDLLSRPDLEDVELRLVTIHSPDETS